MRTRLTTILPLLFAAALLLSACGAGSTPEVTAQPTGAVRTPSPVIVLPTGSPTMPAPSATPDHPVVEEDALRGKAITFWHPWQGEVAARANALVDTFNRENAWDIQVTARSLYSDGALEEVLDAADNTTLPDVLAGSSTQLAVLADAGALQDLNPYLRHPESGFTEAEIADYQADFWAQDVLDSTAGAMRFGIPILRTGRVLFYNQTWAQELGYPNPPVTTVDFRAQSCAAAVVNNQSSSLEKQGTGGWLIDSDPLTGLSWMNAFGAQPFQDGQPFTFDTEEAGEAMAYLQDLADNGCIWVPRSGTSQEELARRRALFITATLQDLPQQKAVMEVHQNQDAWMVIPFPGKAGAGQVYAYGYSLALMRREGASAEHEMAAWLFLHWLSQPEQSSRLAEAWTSLPVRGVVQAQLEGQRDSFPWSVIMPVVERVAPAPVSTQWPLTSRVLEDVTWSIFHLPKEQTGDLLKQADETLREMMDLPTAP